MTFSIVVLPAPLRPTRPTLSPARSVNEARSSVGRPPTSIDSSRTWSTDHGRALGRAARPGFGVLARAVEWLPVSNLKHGPDPTRGPGPGGWNGGKRGACPEGGLDERFLPGPERGPAAAPEVGPRLRG